LKIIDFGTFKELPRRSQEDELKVWNCLLHCAKVLKKNYDEKCDIWSCGGDSCIYCYQVCSIQRKSEKEILEKVEIGYVSLNIRNGSKCPRAKIF